MNAYHLMLLSMLPLAAQAQDATQMGLGQCAAQLMNDKESLWVARKSTLDTSAPAVPEKPSWARKLLVDPVTVQASYGRGSTFVQDGAQDWRIDNEDWKSTVSVVYSLPLGKVIPAPSSPSPKLDRAEIDSKTAFYDLLHDAHIAALEAAQAQTRASAAFADQQAVLTASLMRAKLDKLLDRIKNLTNAKGSLYSCERSG